MVRAQTISTRMTEHHWSVTELDGIQHRLPTDVRQVHCHTDTVHLQDNALERKMETYITIHNREIHHNTQQGNTSQYNTQHSTTQHRRLHLYTLVYGQCGVRLVNIISYYCVILQGSLMGPLHFVKFLNDYGVLTD